MKEGGDLLPLSDSKISADAGVFGKGRYKFWALAAILLLAFWSMLTGTVTLRWSAGDLNRLPRESSAPLHTDLDVLEMEEREKVVQHMWDVYTHNRRIRLPKFWQEAFEAAYEDLAGDDSAARKAAVAEIARMSVRMVDLETSPLNAKIVNKERNIKAGDGTIVIPSLDSASLSSVGTR